MCLFEITIAKLPVDGKVSKMQVEVHGVPWNQIGPDGPDAKTAEFTDKLASFQVAEYTSYLLNIYAAPNPVCEKNKKRRMEREREKPKMADNEGTLPEGQTEEKTVETLHVSTTEPKISSKPEVNTTLCSSDTEAQNAKYECRQKVCKVPLVNTPPNLISADKNYGVPLKTVIVNLEDWKDYQNLAFSVNTTAERSEADAGQAVLVPSEAGGLHAKNPADTIVSDQPANDGSDSGKAGGTKDESEDGSHQMTDPLKIQLLVANSLIITIQSSSKKLYALELNNNEGISSTKALIEKRNCPEISETALTDDGIPLVPSRKEIIRELVRERLRSLGMEDTECHNFLETRETEFIQHRALSIRVPLVTKTDTTPKDNARVGNDSGSVGNDATVPLSTSFEVQARYQTLVHHSDNLSKIVNSASVSAIEASIYLILPHISLASMGNKLNNLGPSLVDDWLEVIYTAAYQLKPTDPSHVQILVEREMKHVTRAAEELLKMSKKTLGKVRKLDSLAQKKYKKAGLPKMSDNKFAAPPISTFPVNKADIGYSGFLQKMGVSASKLYPNHVYITVGKYGVLLKRNLRDSWFHYDSLSYPERRLIFLGLMEHMQETLRAVASVIQRIQELQVTGYPANVHSHLKVVFELMSTLNRGKEMPGTMKENILNRGTSILSAFARLITVVHEIYSMAKVSYGKFHATYYDPEDAQRYKLKKSEQKTARVQLIVPFSSLALDGVAVLKMRSSDSPADGANANPPAGGSRKGSKTTDKEAIFEKGTLF